MNNIKYYSYDKSTVLLTKEVYQRLREKGKFGETFSDIVERLLNQIDYFENKNKGGKDTLLMIQLTFLLKAVKIIVIISVLVNGKFLDLK